MDTPASKTSKATKRDKIRIAYWMNEQQYPMDREATIIRAVIKADVRRFGQTGGF